MYGMTISELNRQFNTNIMIVLAVVMLVLITAAIVWCVAAVRASKETDLRTLERLAKKDHEREARSRQHKLFHENERQIRDLTCR